MIETKYFIKKDFIGWPTGIISGKYDNGKKVSGDFIAPKYLGKCKSFNSIDEIKEFKMCNCGKIDCKVNELLAKLVDEFYQPAEFV